MQGKIVPRNRLQHALSYIWELLFVVLGLWMGWRLYWQLALARTDPGDWLILLLPLAALAAGIYGIVHTARGQPTGPAR